MLLKGAALVLGYYGDAGSRPMEDVDVLVRSDDAVAAAAALGELGWSAPQAITSRHVRASHAMAFVGPRGGQMDLHWHLLPESCDAGAGAPLWDRAAMLHVAGVDVRVMDPADQLFHCCAHGVRWEPVAPLRWIADAAMVLTRAPDLDWPRVLEASVRHRATLPVGDALDYLRNELGLEVPPGLVEQLRGVPVSAGDRLAYRWRTRPAGRLLGRLPEHWLRYRGLRTLRQRGEPPIGFVGYLEVAFGCPGPWSLALRGLGRRRWRREAASALDHYERDLSIDSLCADAMGDRSPAGS
jgi:hypothetical protein